MKRELVVRYDVTGLTDGQIYHLAGEAAAQAEASDGHPDCDVSTAVETVARKYQERTDPTGHAAAVFGKTMCTAAQKLNAGALARRLRQIADVRRLARRTQGRIASGSARYLGKRGGK